MNKLPLLFLFLLVIVFFYKIFLGLHPIPADIITGGYFPWVEYKWGTTTGVPVKNPILTDAVSVTYPLKHFLAENIQKGEFPLWNDRIFAGYPVYASPMMAIFFPSNILYLFLTPIWGWTVQVISQLLISSIGMYLLGRHLKLGVAPSLFTSVAFSFGGFSMIWLEWNNQMLTCSLFPWLVLFLEKYITERSPKYGAGLALTLTLQILAGYPPVLIFSLLALTIWYLLRSKPILFDYRLLFFLVLGVAISGIYLMPATELYLNSQRVYEVIDPKEVFLPWEYLVTLVSHDFFGNPATANFWGQGNYLNTALYAGSTTALLALIAVVFWFKNPLTRLLLTIFCLSLLIMTPSLISQTLYNLGLFGGSSMTMNRAAFLINFTLALLAGVALQNLTQKDIRKIVMLGLGLVALLLGLIAYSLFSQNTVAQKNTLVPLLVASITVIVLFLWKAVKRLPAHYMHIVLLVLLVCDLFYYGWKFNPFTPSEYLYPDTSLTKFLKDQDDYRFASELDILPPNMWMPLGLQSISGYDSYYPVEIGRLIAFNNSSDPQANPQTKHAVLTKFDSEALNQASTKYFLTLKRDEKINEVFDQPKFTKVFEEGKVAVFENSQAFPRAYLKSDPSTAIELSSITNSHYKLTIAPKSDDTLFITNTYYPGWEAKIGDKYLVIEKANGAFQSISVPEGKSTIDLYFQPTTLKIGATISLLGLLGIIWAFRSSYSNSATKSSV